MRCRYSRRLYLLKSQFLNPDYIDESDLMFLESLIEFHANYVKSCSESVGIDSSLLPEKFQQLFNKICTNYSQVTESTLKTELYKKFDLEFKGEERHVRDTKEKIIDYLQHKKGHIFTHRRVEFFLNIAMTIKEDELRKMCKEMLFSIKSPRRPNLGIRKRDFNNNMADKDNNILQNNKDVPLSERIDIQTTPIEERETLLLPYLAMFHPPSCIDYEKINRIINADFTELDNDNEQKHQTDIPVMDLNNEVQPESSNSKDKPKRTISEPSETSVANTKTMPELIDIFGKSINQSQTSANRNRSRHKRSITVDKEVPIKSTECSGVHRRREHVMTRDAAVCTRDKRHIHKEPQAPLMENKRQPTATNRDDIIEISDDEETDLRQNIIPDANDTDQIIHFLTHRCSIQPSLHPTLLKDCQLRIELNGFLLFVNIAIRLSLKVPLKADDRKFFDCVFISSMIIGLHCMVHISAAGIHIDKLSTDDYHIVLARLGSVQVAANEAVTSVIDNTRNILINPNLDRLVNLAMFYVHKYQHTGQLLTSSSPPSQSPTSRLTHKQQ